MTAPPEYATIDGMTVEAVTSAGGCTVTVCGDVDSETAPHLRACLLDVLARPDVAAVDLDLTGVTFLDSAGLTALVIVHRAAERSARPLAVRCGPSRAVRRPLQITGLFGLLTVVDA